MSTGLDRSDSPSSEYSDGVSVAPREGAISEKEPMLDWRDNPWPVARATSTSVVSWLNEATASGVANGDA